MLQELVGKKVQVIMTAVDYESGEVVAFNEAWLKLKKKNKVILVYLGSIRRIEVLG